MAVEKCETRHRIYVGFAFALVLYPYYQKLSTLENFGYVVELSTGPQKEKHQWLDKQRGCGRTEQLGILSFEFWLPVPGTR